jgi:hypothetical protein
MLSSAKYLEPKLPIAVEREPPVSSIACAASWPGGDRQGPIVSDVVEALILDLLEWIGPGFRSCSETLDAWKTSCPRLPVWEEANDRGLLERRKAAGHGAVVELSLAGRELLRERGRQIGAPSPRAAVPS